LFWDIFLIIQFSKYKNFSALPFCSRFSIFYIFFEVNWSLSQFYSFLCFYQLKALWEVFKRKKDWLLWSIAELEKEDCGHSKEFQLSCATNKLSCGISDW
jgi:hypothetical protein